MKYIFAPLLVRTSWLSHLDRPISVSISIPLERTLKITLLETVELCAGYSSTCTCFYWFYQIKKSIVLILDSVKFLRTKLFGIPNQIITKTGLIRYLPLLPSASTADISSGNQ